VRRRASQRVRARVPNRLIVPDRRDQQERITHSCRREPPRPRLRTQHPEARAEPSRPMPSRRHRHTAFTRGPALALFRDGAPLCCVGLRLTFTSSRHCGHVPGACWRHHARRHLRWYRCEHSSVVTDIAGGGASGALPALSRRRDAIGPRHIEHMAHAESRSGSCSCPSVASFLEWAATAATICDRLLLVLLSALLSSSLLSSSALSSSSSSPGPLTASLTRSLMKHGSPSSSAIVISSAIAIPSTSSRVASPPP
jgi:hypothetical protein